MYVDDLMNQYFFSLLSSLVIVPCVVFLLCSLLQVTLVVECVFGPSYPSHSLRQVVSELEVHPCGEWII